MESTTTNQANTKLSAETLKNLFQEDMDRYSGLTYESIEFVRTVAHGDYHDAVTAELAFATIWLDAYFAALESVGVNIPDDISPEDLL